MQRPDEQSVYPANPMATYWPQGLEKAIEVAGKESVDDFLNSLNDTSPLLGRLVINAVFGGLYTRPTLSIAEREMIALAGLAATGASTELLTQHLGIALRNGLFPAAVIEIFVQISVYAGVDKALRAIRIAKPFYQAKGLLPIPDHQADPQVNAEDSP